MTLSYFKIDKYLLMMFNYLIMWSIKISLHNTYKGVDLDDVKY